MKDLRFFVSMMNMRTLFFIVGMAALMSSCSINKNIMFQTDTEYEFKKPDLDSTNKEYKLAPFDYITISLFTGDGAMILEYTTSGIERQPNYGGFDLYYILDKNGEVDLPVLGKTKLAGLSIPEAQIYLELKFINYNDPFCLVRVLNRRVMVFTGDGSVGSVVPLANQNISVLEAIALAGGIRERGNASKVKIIRGKNGVNEVYRLNLSTIEGVESAKMIVQAGDIIYVEPVPQITNEFVKDIAPLVSLITSTMILLFVITK
ncbi:MAG: polysaccharide biosynthesis/export family protein [Sediminibacterium sp.]